MAIALILLLALGAPAPDASAQDVRAGLLAADRDVAGVAWREGLAAGLAGVADPQVVYLHPFAPVLAGRERVLGFLRRQSGLGPAVLSWVPLFAEVSRDRGFGVTWGVTAVGAGAAGHEPRFGKYLSAWRHDGTGWRLVAHAQLGLASRDAVTRVADGPGDLRLDESATWCVDADRAFAALAAREGAPAAFEAFAAADAVTFPSTGELVRGPAAIRASLEDGPPAEWIWAPVAAMAARSGDLGFTVGEAEIRVPGAAGAASVIHSKYLSLWRRDPAGGPARFLADGGNARPAP